MSGKKNLLFLGILIVNSLTWSLIFFYQTSVASLPWNVPVNAVTCTVTEVLILGLAYYIFRKNVVIAEKYMWQVRTSKYLLAISLIGNQYFRIYGNWQLSQTSDFDLLLLNFNATMLCSVMICICMGWYSYLYLLCRK